MCRVTNSGLMHAAIVWMEYKLHPDSIAWLVSYFVTMTASMHQTSTLLPCFCGSCMATYKTVILMPFKNAAHPAWIDSGEGNGLCLLPQLASPFLIVLDMRILHLLQSASP